MRNRGYVFQPKYRDQRTRERKTSEMWWISYSIHGKRHRENAHTTKEGDAGKLLKLRLGQAAIGMPVGPQVERTTLSDILRMVEVELRREWSQEPRSHEAREDTSGRFLRRLGQSAKRHRRSDYLLSGQKARAWREQERRGTPISIHTRFAVGPRGSARNGEIESSANSPASSPGCSFTRTVGESKTSAARGRTRARTPVYPGGWSMISAAPRSATSSAPGCRVARR
jgi:hypothetical protein